MARVPLAPRPDPPPQETPALAAGAFGALQVPAFGYLWASGWCWNITRWMSIFLCSFLVNDITGSPFLVQLVGAAFFMPMFLGGAIAGAVADRFDRRRTILRQLLLLIPLALVMGVLVTRGVIEAWMTYPFMVAVGLGGVVDMTSRRALVFDLVGDARATNALALESMSMAGGNTLGSLFGGAVINFVGLGEAFFLIAALYVASYLLLLRVPSPPAQRQGRGASMRADLAEGLRVIRRSEALVGILGVTVIVNLFYFSFMPLVPVFAKEMQVNALLAGLLASGTGFGMMAGSFAWAAWPVRRRGLLYVGGSVLAMAFLFAFAAVQWYPAALLLLVIAGFGSSAFGTMQGVLVMTTAGPEMRGRAMGVLSMAIGSLPFGMIGLGLVAQLTAPATAVMVSVAVGFLVIAAWLARYPKVWTLR
ncbi:MAG: MFS transporter [Dehalococcoidia bacterium]